MDIKPPLKYEIRRKSVPNLKLYAVDKPYWFNSLGGLLELTNTDLIDSLDGYIIYNVTGGTVSSGYYVWSGETLDGTSYGDTDCDLSLKLYEWESISKSEAYDDHDIPLFLESSVDEMGVMVGFDGQIEQVEQINQVKQIEKISLLSEIKGQTPSSMITLVIPPKYCI